MPRTESPETPEAEARFVLPFLDFSPFLAHFSFVPMPMPLLLHVSEPTSSSRMLLCVRSRILGRKVMKKRSHLVQLSSPSARVSPRGLVPAAGSANTCAWSPIVKAVPGRRGTSLSTSIA